VEISNDVERTREFYEGYGFTIPAAFDVEGTVSGQFGVIATPTNYLLDRAGRIVWRHYGYRPGDEEQMRREISEVLGDG
jgi:peroxiredoxin